jgi:septal ring factor EnvC (AmiA/AmiB activator)
MLARLLVVAFFAVVGMGIYTFTVKTDLDQAKADAATIAQDRDTWKTRFNQYQSESKGVQAKLDQCTSQTSDLQAQLDTLNAAAAAKKAPAKR